MHTVAVRYGRLPGVSKPISRLVQGTVRVSSETWDESSRLLDAVYGLGCTCFDTAHCYGGGDNERTVGRWIRERGIRDQVVILGKGAHPYGGRNRVTPEDIAEDIADSLERFGTEYIDLYLLHRDDPAVPVGDIVDALHEHRREGRIHAYGGSNWTHGRIEEANRYARDHGKLPFVASSPQFGLVWPQREVWEGCLTIGRPQDEAAREWYRARTKRPRTGLRSEPPRSWDGNVAVFAWSSLGGGFFSGRMQRANLQEHTEYFDRLCADCYGHEENFLRRERAEELAARKGATAAQVALAWLFHQPMELYALVGARSPAEFMENAASLTLELSQSELEWLETGRERARD